MPQSNARRRTFLKMNNSEREINRPITHLFKRLFDNLYGKAFQRKINDKIKLIKKHEFIININNCFLDYLKQFVEIKILYALDNDYLPNQNSYRIQNLRNYTS